MNEKQQWVGGYMEWFGKIFEALKLPTPVVFSVLIASILILLLPDGYLNWLMVLAIKQDYGMYFGMAALCSFAVLVVRIVRTGWKYWSRCQQQEEVQKMAAGRVKQLDPVEQAVLREFYFVQRQNTLKLPIDDPVVAGLIQSGVLQQVGQLGTHLAGNSVFNVKVAPNIQLTNNLLGVVDVLSDSDWRLIMENRPHIMRRIERYGRLIL